MTNSGPPDWQLWLFDGRDDGDPMELLLERGLRPEEVLGRYAQLFRDAHILREYFDNETIATGLGQFIRPESLFVASLRDPKIGLLERLGALDAMGTMFETLVPLLEGGELARSTFFMWWDEVFYFPESEASGDELRSNYLHMSSDSKVVLDRALSLLGGLLDSSCRLTVESAVHGLGHLAHPLAPVLLAEMITRRREWLIEEGLYAYAESARSRELL